MEGIDVNVLDNNGNTLLHYAIKYCTQREWIIPLLISRGANVNKQYKEGFSRQKFSCFFYLIIRCYLYYVCCSGRET